MTLSRYIRIMMLVFTGLLIVAMVIGYLTITSRFNDFLQAERQAKVEELIALTTELLENDDFGSEKLLTLRSYVLRQGFGLRIIGQAGRHIDIGERLRPGLTRREDGPVRQRVSTARGNYELIILPPDNRGSAGTLALERAIQTIVISVALVAVVAVLLLSRQMTKKITKPLATASQRAVAVASGHWSASTAEADSGIEELDHLHDSLSQMTESLTAQAAIRRRIVEQMGHEIKTPLSIVKGKLEAIQDGVILPSESEITALHHEIVELAQLVEGLEDVQDATSHYAFTQAKRFSLKTFLTTIISRVDYSFAKRQLQLDTDLIDVMIESDPVKLKSLMLNLLSNVGKYALTGSRVSLTVKQLNQDVSVQLINRRHTDIDLDANKLATAGYRGGMTRIDGKGLGLFIAKEMARHIGARLEFEVDDKHFIARVFLPCDRKQLEPGTPLG